MPSNEERLASIETKIDFLVEAAKDSKATGQKLAALENRMLGGWLVTTVFAGIVSWYYSHFGNHT